MALPSLVNNCYHDGKQRIEGVKALLNAGAHQENVKHPMGLINDLNQALLPVHAAALLVTHSNSVLLPMDEQRSYRRIIDLGEEAD